MPKIEPPDTHHVAAALGWLELGEAAEALAELDHVSAAVRCHPDVLELRWSALVHANHWDQAVETARALLEKAPQRANGWLHHAYALRRARNGGLKAAWDALLPAARKFPKEPVIPYNLSCYACQMKQLDEARVWLDRAVKAGGKKKIKEMALQDADLELLWEEIRKLY